MSEYMVGDITDFIRESRPQAQNLSRNLLREMRKANQRFIKILVRRDCFKLLKRLSD